MEGKSEPSTHEAETWMSTFKKTYTQKQQEIKKKREIIAKPVPIPFPYYKMLRKLCFERCIRDMSNKVTDLREESCIKECATNLATVAKTFKQDSELSL